MRRIDVLGIGIGVFAVGGILYLGLRWAGLDTLSAGIWSQVLFLGGVLGWIATYLTRVVNNKMTYGQQLRDYEDAVLQKRLEEMSPEALAALQAELAAEVAAAATDPTTASPASPDQSPDQSPDDLPTE